MAKPKHYDPIYADYSHPSKLKVFVVDMDGTLALMGGRNPYDPSTCYKDPPNKPIVDIVEKLSRFYPFVIVSGRWEKYKNLTESWLMKNNLHPMCCYYRKDDDNRNDAIIKREIGEKILKDFDILFVIDDRDRVVKMWRHELKLPCLQVYDGDF